jgi:hypothetical protein
MRITYVGACPGAADDAIDIRMTPESLIAMLAERHIILDEQPRVFESIIPPDRRRHRSQPGGVPAADSLWSEMGARSIVELEGEDLVAEIAQHLLAGKNVLLDPSTRLGCVCSGAIHGTSPKEARSRVTALEPPRSATPVVEEQAPIELDLHVPAAPRTPVDVVAVPPAQRSSSGSPPHGITPVGAPRSGDAISVGSATSGTMPFGHRISPVRGYSPLSESRPARSSNPLMPRPVLGAAPVARGGEGRPLPRAFIARRRSSPKGVSAIPMPNEETELHGGRRHDMPPRDRDVVTPAVPGHQAPAASFVAWPVPPRQLLYIVIAAAMIAISVSTIVGVIVGRALAR